MDTFISELSNKEFPISEKVSGKIIRASVLGLIQQENPHFKPNMYLSINELNRYREKYIEIYLRKQVGELSKSESIVLESLKDKSTISDKVDEEKVQLTLGQRIADKVASFGGSWTFIISFGIFLAGWICLNIFWLANKAFDPFPFILLNLILSTIAAIQAPVIMMSQNRQEEKDRDRGKKDYMVNLKSEMEIRMLHEKMDHLIMNQQTEVLEIHKVQIDLMNDILKQVKESIKK